MRSYTINFDINSKKLYDAAGVEIAATQLPYIRFKEQIEINLQYVTDSSLAAYTGFSGETISSSAAVDNDWNHYLSGALVGGYTGAITSITVSGLTAAPASTGFVQMTNSAGASESVAYTVVAVSGANYVFTVSVTLTNTYADADVAKATEALLMKTTTIDETGKDTGLFVVTLDANNTAFEAAVEGNPSITGCLFEHKVLDATTAVIFVAQFTFICQNTLDDDGVIPPAPTSAYYTSIEVDALLAAKVAGPASATDNALARYDLATGKLIQNSGVILDDSNNMTGVANLVCTTATINGKLTVTGLIDPTGMVFTEQTTVPGGAPSAGEGTVWVKDDTPNALKFTNDAGIDLDIVTGDNYPDGFNGCILERQDITVLASGGFVYFDMEKVGGGDLNVRVNGTVYVLDCTTGAGVDGKARVQLNEGTAAIPAYNYVYIDIVATVATLSASTSYPVPTGTGFAFAGYITIQSDTEVTADGTLLTQRTTDAVSHDGRGRESYQDEKLRVLGANWWSGVGQTLVITPAGGALDQVTLTTLSGIMYQLHRQAIGACSTLTDGVWVANASGAGLLTQFQKLTNLGECLEISDGTALSTQNRVNLTIFFCQSSNGGTCKAFVNLSTGVYASDLNCYNDVDGLSVVSAPAELRQASFLVCRIPLKYTTGASGTWESIGTILGKPTIIDLRGNPLGVSGSAGGSGAVDWANPGTIGSGTPSTGAFTTLSSTGLATLASVDINGGNIDNTAIGAATPAAGTFTDLNATGTSTLGSAIIDASGNVSGVGTLSAGGATVLSSTLQVGGSTNSGALAVRGASDQNLRVVGAVLVANAVVIESLNNAASANIPIEYRATSHTWVGTGVIKMDLTSGILTVVNGITSTGNFTASSTFTQAEQAAPGTPAAGFGVVYPKTDGLLYFKNDVGTEFDLTAAGSPLTTKGDVFTYDTGSQRLAVGTDTHVLTADSAQPTGLKWAAAGVGSGGTVQGTDGTYDIQATLEGATAGNSRGEYTVDLQTLRSAGTMVASAAAATISGGTDNTASGSTSTVGGGDTNNASATTTTIGGGANNTATVSSATVGGGSGNDATAGSATVAGGQTNAASGTTSAIGGGSGNTASGLQSTIPGGINNTASADYSWASGSYAVADHHGEQAYSAGRFSVAGDCQDGAVRQRLSTAGTGQVDLFNDGSSARLTLADGDMYAFVVIVAALQADGSSGRWRRTGNINRQGATTALQGAVTPLDSDYAHANIGALSLDIVADDTNDALAVRITPANATATRWAARIEYVKMNF